jgi:DNA repair exonuclease SbcCD ATPase subunit
MDVVDALKREEAHWQKMIVDAEAAYTTRREELAESIKEYEVELTRVKAEIKAYEDAHEKIRLEDAIRDRKLITREQELRAGWRALNEDKQTLAEEKKRFYQTRDLQA